MKIAIIHFHLKTGGVTSVILAQCRTLLQLGHKVMVICGQKPDHTFAFKVATVPGLAYDERREVFSPPVQIAADILAAVSAVWPRGADIIHVHNPTLAKNRDLQAVLKSLQHSGVRLLCQIHDFAEDGRPNAFFKDDYLADCHYAVLNRRDFSRLKVAGLCEKGLHLLPNPVKNVQGQPIGTPNRGPVLYPVRAIRRKNIGEAILLSLFWGDHPLWITLPPNSATDAVSYRQWRAFAEKHRLPVVFEVGLRMDFAALMHASRFVLSTSITEGFGYAFLEPWLFGKFLRGRLLPEVCQDFIDNGIELNHLYRDLKISLDLLDHQALAATWQNSFARANAMLNLPSSNQVCRRAWHEITADGRIDFALLDEVFQRKVICALLTTPSLRANLIKMNFVPGSSAQHASEQVTIARNRQAVLRAYHSGRYAQRLLSVYQQTLATPVHHAIDKNRLAQSFLQPHAFSLLKWGDVLARQTD